MVFLDWAYIFHGAMLRYIRFFMTYSDVETKSENSSSWRIFSSRFFPTSEKDGTNLFIFVIFFYNIFFAIFELLELLHTVSLLTQTQRCFRTFVFSTHDC